MIECKMDDTKYCEFIFQRLNKLMLNDYEYIIEKPIQINILKQYQVTIFSCATLAIFSFYLGFEYVIFFIICIIFCVIPTIFIWYYNTYRCYKIIIGHVYITPLSPYVVEKIIDENLVCLNIHYTKSRYSPTILRSHIIFNDRISNQKIILICDTEKLILVVHIPIGFPSNIILLKKIHKKIIQTREEAWNNKL